MPWQLITMTVEMVPIGSLLGAQQFRLALGGCGMFDHPMDVSQFRVCGLGSTQFEVADVIALSEVLSQFTGSHSKCDNCDQQKFKFYAIFIFLGVDFIIQHHIC